MVESEKARQPVEITPPDRPTSFRRAASAAGSREAGPRRLADPRLADPRLDYPSLDYAVAMRIRSAVALIAGLLALTPVTMRSQSGAAAPRVSLRDVAARAGLRFVYDQSPTPEKHYIESAPGGLAVFDYNGDGRPDVFFANGASSPGLEKRGPAHWNRLFRNDGDLHFTDVTEQAGVRGVGYAMGAAAADYDNDGHVDLFVAGVRDNQLLRNTGDGRFEDVTRRAGIAGDVWSVAGAWLDYDSDGRLDLWVVTYVQWSADRNPFCGDQSRGFRSYCHPSFYKGLPNRLYRNRGDGTFEDVSARAGLSPHVGKGMSAAIADVDADGRPDVFVTNDTLPNFLFRNTGAGAFEEIGLLAGVSVPAHGRALSGMGVDAQDYDNDGAVDLHLTALTGETFPLFHNDGRGTFTETTLATGLAPLTVKRGGWCTVFADFDNDGWKDLFTANSHANDRIGELEATGWRQANALFVNDGGRRFVDASADAGLATAAAVHRGCGVADFDADGRLDIVVLALGSPAELWRNETAAPRHWIGVRLIGSRSNRDGIGARVTVDGQMRMMTTSIGYASSSYAPLHFGLGARDAVARLEVQWPSGAKQVLERVKADRIVDVREAP
jgi:enediyne biosynthesis protein E4